LIFLDPLPPPHLAMLKWETENIQRSACHVKGPDTPAPCGTNAPSWSRHRFLTPCYQGRFSRAGHRLATGGLWALLELVPSPEVGCTPSGTVESARENFPTTL
jgi:hypothetical protein